MSIFGSDKIPLPLIGGAVVILAGVVASAWWLLRSSDVVLFDRLDGAQLDSVSAELARSGIEYRLDRETGAVHVASDQEQRARLAIMSSGNAFRESVGFELFNGSDFGITEFAQKINYQRAIEGELARTISALDEIKYARVHLVLPEHGLFRKQQREARAAITVFLENGASLTPEQIRGLQRIATAAVPELSEGGVSVTDERGRILSAATSTDDAALDTGGRLAQKQEVERYLSEKVRNVLTKALGAERFALSVDVALDYTRRTTKTERVLDAAQGAGVKRLKESAREDELQGGDRLKEVEYSLGHQIEQVEQATGSIRQIQVGVIIDRDLENVEVAQLRELVAAAVGIDPQRGDKVAVVRHGVAVQRILEQAVELPTPPVEAAGDRVLPAPASAMTFTGWIAIAIALAIALGGAVVLTRRALVQRQEARVNQLRHRLQSWIEAEHAEVSQ